MNTTKIYTNTILFAFLLSLLFLWNGKLQAQCQMACNDTVQVSLGIGCLTEVTAPLVMQDYATTDCLGPLVIEIYGANGNLIPSSPFVDDTYEGQYLDVSVIDLASNNHCDGVIFVEDKLIPLLECHSLDLDCGTSIAPVQSQNFSLATAGSAADNTCTDFSINVSSAITSIADLQLNIDLSHYDISELSAQLTSPAGTSISLFENLICNHSNIAITFDDEAFSTYTDLQNTCDSDPALSGYFQAQNALAIFQNENPNGNWTLTLCDNSVGNIATVNAFSVGINANGISIPFPLPDSAIVSQTPAQSGTQNYTVANFENCGTAILSYTDYTETFDCADPFAEAIYRTWIIEDAVGNTTSCIDSFYFRRLPSGSFDLPGNFDDIAQPALLCEQKMTDPGAAIIPNIGWNALANGYPSPYNVYYPAPNDDIVKWYGTGFPEAFGCNNISFNYTDLRIEVCSGAGSDACFKVLRTWTIDEACTGMVLTHEQIIFVSDKTAPQINGLANTTISTSSVNCTASWNVPAPVLTDNCNATSSLSYSVHASAGNLIYNSSLGIYQLQQIPTGIHQITYTASDCCGNSAVVTTTLTVEDQVPPTAVCVTPITSSLTIDGTVRVLPLSFDDFSNDNCGAVYLKVIRMEDLLGTTDGSNANQNSTTCDPANGDDSASKPGNQIWFDDFVTFCCEDIPGAAKMVVLRAFDIDPGVGPVDPSRMRPGGNLHGHFNDCMSEVTITDKLGPAVFCPADITLECTDNYHDLSITGMATGYDNCQLDTIYFTDNDNLNECGVGTVARVWTAVDHTGRTATCVQTITLEDNTDPVVTFPTPFILVECGTELDLNVTGQPQVSDNCSLLGISKRDQLHYFADSCLKKIIRVWTVMDLCTGMMYSEVQVIKIHDTTPPEITGVPANITVECDNIPAPAIPTITDNCDVSLITTYQETIQPGLCPAESIITRTWTATDNCDNSTVVSQRITVEDTTAPVLSGVPADITLECDQTAPSVNPTATDNCDPLVTISYQQNTIPGICASTYILQRIWTATDDCGNSSQQIQNVNFVDTTAPQFTSVPPAITIECDEAIPAGLVAALDNCDLNTTISLDSTITPGSCAEAQIITRTWTATDDCGNSNTASQIITIIDSTPPVFSNVPPAVTIECDAPLPTDVPAATDNCDDIVDVSVAENTILQSCLDSYVIVRTWTATDNCGNTSSVSQTINITDTTPPVFTNIPADATLECDGTPGNIVPAATDNCDLDVMVTFMQDSISGCIGNATVTRTWMATDNCGNTATITQKITFMDSTPPVISGVPADTLVECDAVPVPAMVSAMDACDPMVVPTFAEVRTDGVCPNSYTLTRTWTAMDDCGNVADTSQVITVVDTTPPVFAGVPAAVTVECDAIPVPAMVTALDNCDPVVTPAMVEVRTDGVCTDSYTLTRTWTAMDDCGNGADTIQVITVVDTTPPVLAGVPADITVLCDAIPAPASTVTATDNCDVMVEIVPEESTENGACTDSYTLIRRWIATDNCGNQAIDTQLIMVIDTIPPVLTGVPGDTTVLCSAVPPPPVIGTDITATDNCDDDVMITLSTDTTNVICTDAFTLVRKWTAVDNCGNITVDSQLLMLIDTVPPSLINIPANITVECDALADTTSAMAVMVTDNCDTNVDVVYTENEDGQCPNDYIIFRTWRATDNCGNRTTKFQLITVIDTVPPQITCPPNVTISIRAGDNPDIINQHKCDTLLTLVPIVSDNCADLVTIRHDSPYAFDTIGSATGRYPIGVHQINFTAEDRCGNISSCSMTITVLDKTRPTLLCSDFEIQLDPIDSTAILFPGEFISRLRDCAIDTLFFVQPIITDTLVIDCSYFGKLFDIAITAIDTSGNATTCTLEDLSITLPDGQPNFCGSDPPPTVFITGHVLTAAGDPIKNTMVYLDGGMNAIDTTSASGKFGFGNIPTGYNYSVQPENDSDPRNGVSTLDLVLISRHILGLQSLDSPFKMIAADVDNSGSINSFDIIELQKLILFVNDNFPNNTSWRFVDSDYLFPLSGDPFTSTFPEVCSINGLDNGLSNVDFVGVKIGDVNGSVVSNVSPDAEDRDAPVGLHFFAGEQYLEPGETYSVDVRAEDFEQITGFQFTIDFDPAVLELVAVENGSLQHHLAVSKNFESQGFLPVSWYQQEALDADAEEVLFTLKLRAKRQSVLSEVLSLNSELTRAEAYTGDLQVVTPQLFFRKEIPTNGGAVEMELFANRPNPFSDETVISFWLPKPGKAILTVTDVSGRVLKRIEENFAGGYHEIAIASTELDASGVLYYQLVTAHQMAARKMVLIRD